MTLLSVIIAHGNGIAAFQRHEKFWLLHKAPVLVCCPRNDPLKTRHETLEPFLAEHAGEEATARLRALMLDLSNRDWTHCVIYEYDSFMLEPRVPETPGFHGILFGNSDSPRFLAPVYANPPWSFDRHSFDLILAKAKEFPGIAEEGYADRYLSALATLAGVPLLHYTPRGFSRGTITGCDLAHARAAIYDGCFAIHGVKQAGILASLEQYWDEAHPTCPSSPSAVNS